MITATIVVIAVLAAIYWLGYANTVVHVKLCKFQRWRGHLFGDPQNARITVWHCGLFSLIRFDDVKPAAVFSEFLMANARLEDFLAERRPQVRDKIRREAAKARRKAREEVKGSVDMWRDTANEASARANDLQQRVYALETTVKTLREMDHGRQ